MQVSSDNISRIRWQRSTLIVTFASGATYSYQGVPKKVFVRLELEQLAKEKGQGSVGRLFETLVKKAGYKYKRLEAGDRNGNQDQGGPRI